MKASEMTNEELANALDGMHRYNSEWGEAVREAAARLRSVTVNTDSRSVIWELQRLLKLAEDALDTIYKCVDNRRGVDVSLLVKNIIADVLSAIHGKGESK